jgi:acyl carrier protein
MEEKLKKIFVDLFNFHDLQDHMTRDDIPDWDSMRHLSLILEIEKEFDLSLSIEDSIHMVSIRAIREIISEHGAI